MQLPEGSMIDWPSFWIGVGAAYGFSIIAGLAIAQLLPSE
jgi:hypothetical protein